MLQYMGAWVGKKPEECGGINVNSDFGLSVTDMTLAEMTQAYQAGLFSRGMVWAELQRRGRLSDEFDPKEAAAEIEADARQQPGPSGAGGLADKILGAGGATGKGQPDPNRQGQAA
jgi:hypothetical protein